MVKKFESDTPSFDEIRKLRKPRRKTVELAADPTIYDDISLLESEVRVAEAGDKRENRTPVAPKLRKQLEDLEGQARESTVKWVMQELPRPTYNALIDAHQPSKEAREANRSLRWDEESFAPALIAAACVQPDLSDEQAAEIWNEWGPYVAYALFNAAWEVQERAPQVPFTLRSTAATDGSEANLTSASETDVPSDTTSS